MQYLTIEILKIKIPKRKGCNSKSNIFSVFKVERYKKKDILSTLLAPLK